MNLSKYINELLYRYDCVIIPSFGGFVSNKIGAKVDEETHVFFPPTKQITFNSYLKHNDGLLANHIAACENISFDKANILISTEISLWMKSLNTANIKLDHIGSLLYNEDKQICFEPLVNSNFDINSFGLAPAQATSVFRIENLKSDKIKSQFIESKESYDDLPKLIIEEETKVKTIPLYIKYAASVAILMTLVSTYKMYETNQINQSLVENHENIQNRIQQATFLIDKPLSTVNVKVNLTKNIDKKVGKETKEINKVVPKVIKNEYFVISGAFRSLKNVNKKIRILKAKGYSPELVKKNKWGFNLVSYKSFSNSVDAQAFLQEIKKEDSDAWTLFRKN